MSEVSETYKLVFKIKNSFNGLWLEQVYVANAISARAQYLNYLSMEDNNLAKHLRVYKAVGSKWRKVDAIIEWEIKESCISKHS